MKKERIKEILESDEFQSAAKVEKFKESLTDLNSLFYGAMVFFSCSIVYMIYYMHVTGSPLALMIDGLLVFWIGGAYIGRLIKIFIERP